MKTEGKALMANGNSIALFEDVWKVNEHDHAYIYIMFSGDNYRDVSFGQIIAPIDGWVPATKTQRNTFVKSLSNVLFKASVVMDLLADIIDEEQNEAEDAAKEIG